MPSRELSDQARVKSVLNYLQQEWSRLFRLTTVEQAINALGFRDEAGELRRLVGQELRFNPQIHPALTQWGVCTFILTEDEKLLARSLVQAPKKAGEGDDEINVFEMETPLEGSEKATVLVVEQLKRLEQAGLVKEGKRKGKGGGPEPSNEYVLVPNWEELAGPLEFNFHTLQRENGQRFNVPCAFDYLMLARSEFMKEKLKIIDSCVHCTTPITLTIDNGQIKEVEPAGALIFRGGG